MWDTIWKQFEKNGIRIRSGKIQDATFIESDPGKHGRKKLPVNMDPADPSPNTRTEEISGNTHERKKLTKDIFQKPSVYISILNIHIQNKVLMNFVDGIRVKRLRKIIIFLVFHKQFYQLGLSG